MASEITEEGEIGSSFTTAEKEAEKKRIRRIIEYQKSLYLSSSAAIIMPSSSSSPFSHSRRSNSLMDLMKEGSTSLRRLFDLEHTTLSAYLHHYSGSPIIKPIPLWGSDSDDEIHGDPWSSMKQQMEIAAADHRSVLDEEVVTKQRIRRRKLNRKKSFRNLRKFRGFRVFKLRLKRLRIFLCGRIF